MSDVHEGPTKGGREDPTGSRKVEQNGKVSRTGKVRRAKEGVG